MKCLKKAIIKRFLVFSLLIAIIESMIDSLFDDWIFLVLSDQHFIEALGVYIVLSGLVFIIGAYGFYRSISRVIREETIRIEKEKSLLYTKILHDLKTPMTSIMGFAKALDDGVVIPERQKEVMNTIYLNTKRANSLLESLFEYTKLEANEIPLKMKKQDICKIVREAVAAYYTLFEDKGIIVELDIPEYEIIVQLDEKEFLRAVNNLLQNALQHNVAETKVFIKICVVKENVRVVVADSGQDIPITMRKHIFEAFGRLEEARSSVSGSGLGLAITKTIMERHNGKAYVADGTDGYTKSFVLEFLNLCN